MNGIAVIDTETTGIYKNQDRILEVAVVRLDDNAQIVDEYVTLVNPKRDVGLTEMHGIRAADLINAPEFKDIAGDLVERISGTVIAGHNVAFDSGLIRAEFRRLNFDLPTWSVFCTLKLAYKFGPTSRKLSSCCQHFQIEHGIAHSALDDARATAKLLRCYFDIAEKSGISRNELLHQIQSTSDCGWPTLEKRNIVFTRNCAQKVVREQYSYIANIVSRLPDVECVESAAYLQILDRALEDRILTVNESEALEAVAREIGLSKAKAEEVHVNYLRALSQIAWQDGTISDTERKDLLEVAKLLGLGADVFEQIVRDTSPGRISSLAVSQRPGAEFSGKSVCFTGALVSKVGGKIISREDAHNFAVAAGMVVKEGVSKTLDILVIADPDSQSGKAKKAREYGTRIIAERVFWQKIGLTVE